MRVHALFIVILCAAITILLRAAPFVLFGGKRGIPPHIRKLGRLLPPAIMTALVVYCLKSVPIGGLTSGARQLISAAAVALLHAFGGNTFLSIAGGTALYMLLIRL